ncbi:MAG: transglutaminase domain-containing protein, partial [Candidatus Delongbacteria bacterium]|nr:transglutaminase domain-containing protein [Candidatus Delongbacteria bacterium]
MVLPFLILSAVSSFSGNDLSERIISASISFEKTDRAEKLEGEIIYTAFSPSEAGRLSRISYDASRSSLSTYEITGFSEETNEEIMPLKIEKISTSSGLPFSYSGYVEEYAVFPDFWGRAVIKIRYSMLTDSTIWGNDFIFSLPVGDQLPIDSLHIFVISLKPFTWKCGEKSGDVTPVPGIPETLSVSFFSLDAVDADIYPSEGLFFKASSFNDFSQIARKCLVLFGGKLRADSVVRQKALELSTGFSREERARRIFDFVSSSIAYTAIEWGWRGFYPQEPSLTLSAGRGDCKDKVSLLIAMLESAGIRAWPALLATRGSPDVSLSPPAVFFNHVIALVEIKSESIFCDPSDFGTPFGVLPLRDRSVNALVLFDDSFMLMRTPSDFEETYRRVITGFISSDGMA